MEIFTMRFKKLLLAFATALMLALAGPVLAAKQFRSPFDANSGNPDVGNSAQVTQPVPNPKAQAATARLLHNESQGLSGDYSVDRYDAAQLSSPTPNWHAQAKTQRMLKRESAGLSGVYPVDLGDSHQVQKPQSSPQAQRQTAMMLEQENQASGIITGQYD
jgi:hypothetical protein